MTVQGKRLRRRPRRQDVAPARFFEICHPHIWGCGIDIYASFRAFKAAETSTDLNRCQHISTHVNTSQHRQGDPHIWDLHFCQEGDGKAACGLKTCYISIPKPPMGKMIRRRKLLEMCARRPQGRQSPAPVLGVRPRVRQFAPRSEAETGCTLC